MEEDRKVGDSRRNQSKGQVFKIRKEEKKVDLGENYIRNQWKNSFRLQELLF